jgi:hypothetical protein
MEVRTWPWKSVRWPWKSGRSHRIQDGGPGSHRTVAMEVMMVAREVRTVMEERTVAMEVRTVAMEIQDSGHLKSGQWP